MADHSLGLLSIHLFLPIAAVVEPVQEKEAAPAENVQETKTTTTKEDDNMGYVSRIFDTPLGYGVCSSKQENKLIIRVPLQYVFSRWLYRIAPAPSTTTAL